VNRVKQLLKEGKPALGTWVTIGHPEVAEILSRQGFDWMLFDTEHSPLSIETIETLIQAMGASETVPLIRVAWNDPVMIKRALDIGSYGVVIPWVNSREDAVNAVKACRYPPEGIRGVGPRRAADYGERAIEYFERADKELLVVVQIETQKSIDSAEEIFSVPGIDAFLIGPADLSASLGIFGQWNHPRLEEAIQRVVRAAREAGIACGIVPLDLEDAKKRLKEGFQFISLGGDITYLIAGAQEAINSTRGFLRESTT
jgi:2-keto-3-deoxy-L-rhamnonate aldolase RhmA